jgi:sarcosine oxidase
MSNSRFDVIIVGLGAMGSSAAFHLASRGARVLGLEKFDIPHTHGSSHGFSRMTRMAYHEHPDYVPLLKSAFTLWHELESLGGQKLIYPVGGLYMGPLAGMLVAGSLKAAREHHLPHEILDRDELRRRYPQFELPDDFVGMLERDAGFILPEKAIATAALLALRHGAELHGREPVMEWTNDGDGVRVTTPRNTYLASKIIFCGGAWTDRLVRDLGIPLNVTRQILAWVWPKTPAMFEPGKLPVWAIDHLDDTIHYGFPMMLDSPGFKLAHHAAGETADPDKVNRDIAPSDEENLRALLKRNIPQADGPLLSARVCLYTNSPDHHFIVGQLPENPRVILAGGFSGHGFKFAPVIGKALSDLATDGKTPLPIEFLSPARYRT